MKLKMLILCSLISTSAFSFDGPPLPMGGDKRAPNEISFEYKSEDKIFASEAEAKKFSELFLKFKEDQKIKDYLAKVEAEEKAKRDEMMRKGERPDFESMKKEMDLKRKKITKDVVSILSILSPEKNSDQVVECQKATPNKPINAEAIQNIIDTNKASKILLTEEELNKLKQELRAEIKSELREEMKKEAMKDGRPKEEDRNVIDRRTSRPKMTKNENRTNENDMNMAMMMPMQMQMGNQMQNQYQNTQSNGMNSAYIMSMMTPQYQNQNQFSNQFQNQFQYMGQNQMGTVNQFQGMGNNIGIGASFGMNQYQNQNYYSYQNSMPMQGQMMRRPPPMMNQYQSNSYPQMMNNQNNYQTSYSYGFNF